MKKFINFLLVAILALTLISCNFVSGNDSESQQVDRKEFIVNVTYRNSAVSVEKSESSKFSLEVGKEKDLEIPKIENDGTDLALICWVVNGVEAEDSVGISTINVKRTQDGAVVTVGSTTVNLTQGETSISLSTKYPVADVYDLSFAFKTNASAELTTQNSTIVLGVGKMETINLPAVDTVDNDTFNGWLVNGSLAENSVGATTATISRSDEGIQIILGDTTCDFDATVTRFEFSTKYGESVVPPIVDTVSYKITFEYKTNENGATVTDERIIQLEIGDSRPINLPSDVPTAIVDYWTVNGKEVNQSASATTITVTRTENGLTITMAGETIEITETTVKIAMVIKEEEWTPNY